MTADAQAQIITGLVNQRPSNGHVRVHEADAVHAAIEDGNFEEAMDELGQTDCPEGCFVEPDGECPHGHESLGLRMGLI